MERIHSKLCSFGCSWEKYKIQNNLVWSEFGAVLVPPVILHHSSVIRSSCCCPVRPFSSPTPGHHHHHHCHHHQLIQRKCFNWLQYMILYRIVTSTIVHVACKYYQDQCTCCAHYAWTARCWPLAHGRQAPQAGCLSLHQTIKNRHRSRFALLYP